MRHAYEQMPCGCMVLVARGWTYAFCPTHMRSFGQITQKPIKRKRK